MWRGPVGASGRSLCAVCFFFYPRSFRSFLFFCFACDIQFCQSVPIRSHPSASAWAARGPSGLVWLDTALGQGQVDDSHGPRTSNSIMNLNLHLHRRASGLEAGGWRQEGPVVWSGGHRPSAISHHSLHFTLVEPAVSPGQSNASPRLASRTTRSTWSTRSDAPSAHVTRE